jgi:hypothetical protein
MKNLILCFSSFHVNSDPNNHREIEYLNSKGFEKTII